jgi:hypothetical protein
MADKYKMSEVFSQDKYEPMTWRFPMSPDSYPNQAGLYDIRRSYPPSESNTSDERENTRESIDRDFGRTLRSITQGFNPTAFDAWYDSRPDSPNVEATFNARWGALPVLKKDQGRR